MLTDFATYNLYLNPVGIENMFSVMNLALLFAYRNSYLVQSPKISSIYSQHKMNINSVSQQKNVLKRCNRDENVK